MGSETIIPEGIGKGTTGMTVVGVEPDLRIVTGFVVRKRRSKLLITAANARGLFHGRQVEHNGTPGPHRGLKASATKNMTEPPIAAIQKKSMPQE